MSRKPELSRILEVFQIRDGKIFRKNSGTEAGFLKSNGDYRLKLDNESWPARKVAWLMHTGEYPKFQIRLRDGDPKNMSWDNLVSASQLYAERNVRARNCLNCGGEFQASNKAQKCCSRQCGGEWQRRNRPSACRDCGVDLNGAAASQCPACLRVAARLKRLSGKYGLNDQDLTERLKQQGFACAICREAPDAGPVVDHDHTTGEVRGLLCPTCNAGLGFFKDNPATLEAAAAYLRAAQNSG